MVEKRGCYQIGDYLPIPNPFSRSWFALTLCPLSPEGPHLPLSSKRNFLSPLLVGEGRVRWERGARQGGVRARFEGFKTEFDMTA
jgi:hypothetical protein